MKRVSCGIKDGEKLERGERRIGDERQSITVQLCNQIRRGGR